ncbi:ribonuclease III [Candidatus Microgenomates bacterium]|nr:ribonuclease III [Candidatus Microgenomates bacterium]
MTDAKILEKTLGITFVSKKLLTEALTHRSYLNEHRQVKYSNERLEFLGDSVLSVITSTELFRRFPGFPEGKLTSLRSSLVRAQTLAVVAKKLNLGAYLLMSHGEEKSGGRSNPGLLANTFEALLGAIYLDRGLPTAEVFLKAHLFSKIPAGPTISEVFDFKSKLQEVVQEKDRISPNYHVISETGPDHDKTFIVAVLSRKTELARASGKSKQEAEQEAARLALTSIKP